MPYPERVNIKKFYDKELINRITDTLSLNTKNKKRFEFNHKKIESLYYNCMRYKDISKGFYIMGFENYRSKDFTWDALQKGVNLIIEDNTRKSMVIRN